MSEAASREMHDACATIAASRLHRQNSQPKTMIGTPRFSATTARCSGLQLLAELRVDAGALAIDLIGRRAEPRQDRLGESERDLTLTGDDHVGAGRPECRHFPQVAGAREDFARRGSAPAQP